MRPGSFPFMARTGNRQGPSDVEGQGHEPSGGDRRGRPFRSGTIRACARVLFQAVLLLLVGVFVYDIAVNTVRNLASRNIASGFDFLSRNVGLRRRRSRSSPIRASPTTAAPCWSGFLNTLLVSALGIVLATRAGLRDRRDAAVAQLARLAHGRRSTSSSCATCRCCCRSSSGTGWC